MEAIEVLATVLCIVAVSGYVCAGILFLKDSRRYAAAAAIIGWLANLGIFVKNWYINGYPPFASMYQVLSVLSLVFLVLLLVLVKQDKAQIWLTPYFCFGAALPLLGTLFMDRQMRWSLVPALQSVWFVPHVFSYMLSYALCTVAFLISLLPLVKKDDTLQCKSGIYSVLRFAYPFMTLGLLLGAVWADQVWGGYWNWDIKEVWALITSILYACYFHIRRIKTMEKYSIIFSWLAFAALIITFFCVNLFPNNAGSLHTYTLQ